MFHHDKSSRANRPFFVWLRRSVFWLTLISALLRLAYPYNLSAPSTYVLAASNPHPIAIRPKTPAKKVVAQPAPTKKATHYASSTSRQIVTVGYYAPPACQKPTGSQPTQISLASQSNGLSLNQKTVSYGIYGHTSDQLRQQMLSCSPLYGFAGDTQYNMDWSYNKEFLADGQCKLSDVKVGLSISIIVPNWLGSRPNDSLPASWDRFVSALTTHELGHANIEKQYAGKLLNQLELLGPTNCANIYDQAENIAKTQTANTSLANANYDTETKHGTTQSAIVP